MAATRAQIAECQRLRTLVAELITVSEQLCDGRVQAQRRAATPDTAKKTWQTAFVAAAEQELDLFLGPSSVDACDFKAVEAAVRPPP